MTPINVRTAVMASCDAGLMYLARGQAATGAPDRWPNIRATLNHQSLLSFKSFRTFHSKRFRATNRSQVIKQSNLPLKTALKNVNRLFTNRFVLTAMAAKEIVCVNPSENRVRPQTVGVGLAVMMNVLQNDSKMAASRTADNSRPAALMIGV